MEQGKVVRGKMIDSGYHFFAAFDRDSRLVSVYGYQHFFGELPQTRVSAVMRADREAKPEIVYQVAGPIANLLYVAVTGRLRGDDPLAACAETALRARRCLDLVPGWWGELCRKALEQFGPYYQPWWGVVKLAEGFVVLDDPDYGRREPLYGGVLEPVPVAQWEVVDAG